MSNIRLRNVTKRFGSTVTLHNVNLDIEDGEFAVFVGPSGCGKSTLLRMIAGLEEVSDGEVLIGDEVMNDVAPSHRGVAMVFQSYALYPHMTVAENMGYGLKVNKVPKEEIRRQVEMVAKTLQLSHLLDRKPKQLSGGQRQRVAIARALVNEPRVLLLDEPLGALDLKLREQMQFELKKLQQDLGITFIFVTHDQGEALSMSDRVAVFNNGRIEQVDTPRELYLRPRTPFVASFVGTSNVFAPAMAETLCGMTGSWALRPEHIRLNEGGEVQVQGRIQAVQYQGAATRYELLLEGGEKLLVSQANFSAGLTAEGPTVGHVVLASWARDAMVALDGGR